MHSRAILHLAAGLVFFLVPGLTAQTVQFADPLIEEAVREALDQPSGAITQERMGSLITLRKDGFPERKVVNLEGLQHAVNLQALYLPRNAITDLGPIAGLANLTALDVRENEISDFSPLASTSGMRFLAVTRNPYSSLGFLSYFPNLTRLMIGGGQVPASAYTVLSGFPNLVELYLEFADISDPGFLGSLSGLQILGLSFNRIRDLAPLRLAEKPGLHTLYLYQNDLGLEQILGAKLEELSALRVLDVRSNYLTLLPGSDYETWLKKMETERKVTVYSFGQRQMFSEDVVTGDGSFAGWVPSSWLGLVYVAFYPWVYATEYGWMHASSDDPHAAFLWMPAHGYLYTTKSIFPAGPGWVYSFRESSWALLVPGGSLAPLLVSDSTIDSE